MTAFRRFLVLLISSMSALASSPIWAQTSDGAGATVLFSCQIRDSNINVQVSLSGNALTYVSGTDLTNPNVRVTNVFSHDQYVPGPAFPLRHDTVTLVDDDGTTYQVRQTLNMITVAIQRYGVVTITDPDGQQSNLQCRGHIITNLNELIGLITETPVQILERCLARAQDLHACFGVIARLETHKGKCEQAGIRSTCWGIEQRVWDHKLALVMSDMIAKANQNIGMAAGERLVVSHADWLSARDASCAMGGDGYAAGYPYCFVQPTIDRLAEMLDPKAHPLFE